ncbi:MAG: UvrD-helicase domain-containing protein [Tannerellaceae bacterium]|jgi:ATP-dependent exoDNAse (exonuclease V) beta subunit|nr:UvrD-helicase domain-containing protein [Tannerellaceae bacterium]
MLTIYRASAGTGKTHKLTGEYLKLLFSSENAYRRILAVTFTNKATDEMKSRIIKELYHLSARRPSSYLPMLAAEYKLPENKVRQKAKDILTAILHDYAAFNISTIDRFFQQTMRAFTREIGLQGGYGIELDQELVLSEAVDNLLGGLEKSENKELLGWLLRFAEDKIENGGEWNLRREIMSLGREVFKESYKACSDKISKDIEDKQALERYKNELYGIIRSSEARLKALGEKGMAILSQYALLPSDFKGGSRSPLLYLEKYARGEVKEPTATFVALEDTEEAFYTRTTPPGKVQIIGCAFRNGLNDCIKDIVNFFREPTYYTAKETVRYYYTLGILGDISHQIASYRKEKNILLIADTTELLNKIIDGSDTPFIFEKTGTHIDHYMMDEFQDTSDMQWHNFRPLIAESLAHRHNNLIVGDVKQSIYRFRNSNWKLLDEQVQKDFLREQVQEETLRENWRSFRRIVLFNNAVFSAAPALLQDMYNETLSASSLSEAGRQTFRNAILSAYEGSEQQTAPIFQDKEGHVRVEFIPENDENEADWKEEVLCRLPAVLEQLQDNGYPLKDIAILIRTNREGALVAETLLAYKETHPDSPYRYDIISDDALYVSASPAVRFIVAILRYLKNPANATNKQLAFLAYATLTGRFADIETRAFDPATSQALQALSHHALYEMTEGIFRLFGDSFPGNEQVFVQAFFDMSLEFSQKGTPDLSRFLKWWDETGVRKTIATPDGQDAIRILTIHKSKGLGFKAVILPFCEWEIDHRPTLPVVLWCRPEKAPFNRLHLVPVRYGQALTKTYYAKDYFKERLHASIDNLNTLYVAFTRAKEELIVFAPWPKKTATTAQLLWATLESSPSFHAQSGVFETGTSAPAASPGKEEPATEEIPMGRLHSVSPNERLYLRLHGQDFFFDNAQRKHGVLMHKILSRILTHRDIPASVETFRQEGIIGREEARQLVSSLRTALDHPGVASWYDGSARVWNEVEILCGKEQTRRPDRVMIFNEKVVVVDYKFGERQTSQHHAQVKRYIKLIRQMGYPRVEGYLWYVSLRKIEPA